MTNILATKAVLASLNVGGWSARRFDRKVTDETNKAHGAKEDAGRYNKMLIDKVHLDPLTKIAGAARISLYGMTQPWMDEGPRILPSALVVKYSEVMRKAKQDYEQAIEKFALGYPAMIEQAKRNLNGMFDLADYPDASVIRSKFTFDHKLLPIPDADDFRVSVSRQYLDQMREDVEERLNAALNAAMLDTKQRIITAVGNMVERLNAYTGKREGSFKDSLVGNIRELVEVLPSFNITADPELAKIIKRMETALCAEEPDTLRSKPRVRKSVAAEAEAILQQVSQFMV
jgi:hypothetical protein